MTIDGYIAGPDGDISWHNVDEEFQELANKASHSGNTLIFGRVTYELMARFWPTPEALRTDPFVAQGMNAAEKIVFSRSLNKADWNNTRLVKHDMVGEIRRLKQQPGKDLTILGSGSIVAQLAQEGLIDEYQILVNPVILGGGKTMFEGMKTKANLKLVSARTFGNGNILLTYEPAREGAPGVSIARTRKAMVTDFLQLVVSGRVEVAYQKYVDMNGKHHNAYFPAGFAALKQAMIENHAQFPHKKIEIKRVLMDGDVVAAHSHVSLNPGDKQMAVVHLFRFHGDRIVEMWDIGQTLQAGSLNKDGIF